MRTFVADSARYEARVKEHRKEFGPVGLEKLKRPSMPEYLQLWMELQEWPGSLLLDGGILQQPQWVWEMVCLAGREYTNALRMNRELIDTLTGG